MLISNRLESDKLESEGVVMAEPHFVFSSRVTLELILNLVDVRADNARAF